jgi:hypothetical protein
MFRDDYSGWRYSSGFIQNQKTFQGGIDLGNVSHDHFELAKDIRVIGFWVEIEIHELKDGKEKQSFQRRFIAFTDQNFACNKFEQMNHSNSVDYIGDTMQFSDYPFIQGMRAEFTLRAPLQDNCQFGGLNIVQTFLFSDYNDNPAHEPTGGLNAARLFPLIKFNFIDNDDFNKNLKEEKDKYCLVRSIRADYRFHFRLSSNVQINELKKISLDDYTRIVLKKPSQAGVFTDSNSFFQMARAGSMGFFEIAASYGTPFGEDNLEAGKTATNAIFAAAEKPLIYELVADGLRNSKSEIKREKKNRTWGWDNIHWWNFRGQAQDMISAPGAFHALHMHWKWSSLVTEAAKGREKQFSANQKLKKFIDSDGWWLKGVLVDPACFCQTIKFAVVEYSESKDPSKKTIDDNFSTENFEDLFIKSEPENIADGSNLVLWYSVKVEDEYLHDSYDYEGDLWNTRSSRNYSSQLSGTIFIHGVFFAHEPEPPEDKRNPTNTVGARKELYTPKTKEKILNERNWRRNIEEEI